MAQSGTLWDSQNEAPARERSLNFAQERLLRSTFQNLLSADDLESFTSEVLRSNWDSARRILDRYDLGSFESYAGRKNHRYYSSEALALHLYIYRQMKQSSVWLYPGPPDNLGYFEEVRLILGNSPDLLAPGNLRSEAFYELGLHYEWAVITGVRENFQARRAIPRLRNQDSRFRSHVLALRELAQFGSDEEIHAATMSSLVNASSTRRLVNQQLRANNPVRTPVLRPRLADSIFQSLHMNGQMRGFLLNGALPDSFVSPESKSFERLVSGLRKESLHYILKLREACEWRAAQGS